MKLLATGGKIFTSRSGQVAVNAAVGLLLARQLAPAGLGHYSLTLAFVMLVAALFNGGMGLAAVPPLRRAHVTLGRMLQAQGCWIVLMAGLTVLLVIGGSRTGAAALAVSHLGWDGAAALGSAVAIVALLAFDIFFYDLLAVGRLVVGPLVNLCRAVAHIAILMIVMLVGRLHLSSAVAAFAVAQLLAALAVAVMLWRRSRQEGVPGAGQEMAAGATPVGDSAAKTASPLSAAAPLGLPRDLTLPALIGATVRRGWHGQVSAVASLLHLRLNLVLVSAFCDATTVGIYAFAAMAGELLWHLPGALSPVLVYSSSAPDQMEERDRLAARAVRVALAATAAVALPLGLAAGPLLNVLFGGAYAASAPALRALLPGVVAFAPGAVLAGDFIGRGRPQWNAQASLLTVAVSLLAGLLLIPSYAAVGAAWAGTAAYAVGATVMVTRFRKATGLPLREILLVKRHDFR